MRDSKGTGAEFKEYGGKEEEKWSTLIEKGRDKRGKAGKEKQMRDKMLARARNNEQTDK